MEVRYFHRYTGETETEKVYGDRAIRWLYGARMGRGLGTILAKKWFSHLYGFFQDTPLSKGKIATFVEDFGIPMEDFLPDEKSDGIDPYPSFNRFFVRRFREGKRPFVQGNRMAAFGEARYLGYEALDGGLPVKGVVAGAGGLLGQARWKDVFEGGPALVARLCPVDYHRFHFPDDGRIVDSYPVSGRLHSVNPMAIGARRDILSTNERRVSILETAVFGRIAYIEIGAMCVGRIVETFGGTDFKRGDEKGYFLFGASSIVLLGEKDRWKPDEDILAKSREGLETYVRLGDGIARC